MTFSSSQWINILIIGKQLVQREATRKQYTEVNLEYECTYAVESSPTLL